MALTKEKLKSFIDLCKTEKVAKVLLVEEFPFYCESEYDDAYKYFESRGMIQTPVETIDDITICRWIMEYLNNYEYKGFPDTIGAVMKKSGGRLDPMRIRDIAEKFLK